MSHRARWWAVGVLAAAVVLAEWLRQPASLWVWLEWLILPAALAALRPIRGPGPTTLALGLAALVVAVTAAQRRIGRIERDWVTQREDQVRAASRRLDGELRSAFRRTERLAAQAAQAAGGDRRAAFQRLAAAVPSQAPEMGVAIFEGTGTPWAWAGRHRVLPQPGGDSIAVRTSGYYVVLETRRHSELGRLVVASALVWAHPAAPERKRSLAEAFRAKTGVGLAVFPPGTAPRGPDVFDYEEPTTAGPRLLFSVQPIPPEQGAAKEAAVRDTGRILAWLLLLLFAAALASVAGTRERYAVLLVALWVALRAPVGAALGLADLFSPATFFRPFLGPLSASAGVLALTGTIATLAGISLWHRRIARCGWRVALGVLLLVGAPYLISELGRGITPPSDGVPIRLWLTWQLTLVVTVSAVIIMAAALFRGNQDPGDSTRRIWIGVGLALSAAAVGLFVWNPRFGWPEWYTFLWTPALVLVTLPAPRWATITGIALVAGSSAALVTWGAEFNGRLQVAQRDLNRLGPVEDPLATPLLERFGDQLAQGPPLRSASEMYARWRLSALGGQDYPARLALWQPNGTRRAEISLDSLDLPASLVATMVRNLAPGATRQVIPVYRVPGTHYILLQRLGPDAVLSAAIGPRSRLIVPDRLARMLRSPSETPPLYEMTLSPPEPDVPPDTVRQGWRRDGWVLRNERRIALPGGMRHVHATIDLRSPAPILVRGALVVFLDALFLGLLWLVTDTGINPLLRRLSYRRAIRSFQLRLAITLAVFFVIPAASFVAWSFSRLGDEAERGRDLLITQALRDAVLTAGGLLQGPANLLEDGLRDLSNRIDADLVLYSGGTLVATSAPILADLALVEPLVDPVAFQSLALSDELELTRDATIHGRSVRVGYRVAQSGPPGGIGILATPQLAEDLTRGESRDDLAFVLLLTALAGIGAALAGARLAARALSRPVADLRRLARAVGQRQPVTVAPGSPPIEFEAVFGAFHRMAADVRSSQAALEEARRRTATVLANVATGVLALEPEGTVILSNARARELLGQPLPEGAPFDAGLDSEWAPFITAVGRFLRSPQTAAEASEFELAGRRLRLQLAGLDSDPGGVVLALTDLTEVTQAERVLAWGEMARQVAHEIKNPLTPIRLGVQHLRRVYRDRQTDFERTLAETSERILAEIDRLDTIARSFSRFAAPANRAAPLEPVDLTAVSREVVGLYQLAGEGISVRFEGNGRILVAARRDEVKEVLGNLLENARNAGARCITVTVTRDQLSVEDDGRGIAPELLPRIFEPRFSTTTSGSGLGLAIVRRLVEGWGGRIEVQSELGKGTGVLIRWSTDQEYGPSPAL